MRLLRYAAIAAISVSTLAASEDALQRFHGTYRGLKTVSFSFKSSGSASGSIKAQRGGLYRVVVGDRTIVSNGRIVWNATSGTKTVLINDYKPTSADVSIERVFFDVMSVYRSSAKPLPSGSTLVRLDAPNPQAQIAGITNVELTCNAAFVVTSVRIMSNGAVSEFSISNLRTNPRIPASTFSFVVPKGWQLHDIR